MPLKDLYGLFPKLKQYHHTITSEPDKTYNCVAWALDKKNEFWTPHGTIIPASFPPYVWPKDVPQDGSLDSYIILFEKMGYELTDHPKPEPGFRKIALYALDGQFTHVAKQAPKGKWSSKLGDVEDIEHDLAGLEKDGLYAYGRVERYMKKPTTTKTKSPA